MEVRDGGEQRHDLIGMNHDADDRGRQGKQDDQQQAQGHQRHGRPAPPSQGGLQPHHQRPGGDHQGGCPDKGREERPDDEERGGDHAADAENHERRAGEVVSYLGH